jgi:hypothetical protein
MSHRFDYGLCLDLDQNRCIKIFQSPVGIVPYVSPGMHTVRAKIVWACLEHAYACLQEARHILQTLVDRSACKSCGCIDEFPVPRSSCKSDRLRNDSGHRYGPLETRLRTFLYISNSVSRCRCDAEKHLSESIFCRCHIVHGGKCAS